MCALQPKRFTIEGRVNNSEDMGIVLTLQTGNTPPSFPLKGGGYCHQNA